MNKTVINLQEYIDFIKENDGAIETYANLDDMTSPEKTWENQKEMEKQGLHPIPVYHLAEHNDYLEMAMKYPYFAVGGLTLKGDGALRPRLNKVFGKVCPKENNFLPTHKVHGFGITTPELLISYPWYSADSTSWVMYGRFGIILLPRYTDNKFRYDKPPHTFAISSRSKAVGDKNHYDNLSPMDREWIENYCLGKGFPIGKTEIQEVPVGHVLKENEKWTDRKKKDKVEIIIEKGLCCDGEMRDAINLAYFLDLEKYQPTWPYAWGTGVIPYDFI